MSKPQPKGHVADGKLRLPPVGDGNSVDVDWVEVGRVVVPDTRTADLVRGSEVMLDSLEDTALGVTTGTPDVIEVIAMPFAKERPAAIAIPDLKASMVDLRGRIS